MLNAERNREMVKRKIKNAVICLLLAALMVAGVIAYNNYSARPKTDVDNRTVVRDINNICYRFDTEPDFETRGMPWDSEIPEFVSEDIQYLEENTEFWNFKYFWKDWAFEIHLDVNGEPYLTPINYKFFNAENYEAHNFSIYRLGDDKLVVYGDCMGSFTRFEFGEGFYDREHLTYNHDVPFSEKKSIIISFGPEYKLCFPEDMNTVYVYKGGEIVSPKYKIENGSHVLWQGLFQTESDKLVMFYVIPTENGKAEIRVENVGDLSGMKEGDAVKIDTPDERHLSFPVFIDKEGKLWMPAPRDWNTFFSAKKGEIIENANFAMELVQLGKDNFKRAEFELQNSGVSGDSWVAHIIFDINGREISYTYVVNGYDGGITRAKKELPEEKTVFTEGEFWDFITTIRETYAQYYDYPEGT